jgi:vitamin B12 transporter
MQSNERAAPRGVRFAALIMLCAAYAAVPANAAEDDKKKNSGGLLPETVVTATRMTTPSRTVGSAITVISREDLERRQIRFVSDALRRVPGVSVNRSGGFGSFTGLRLRGAEANQTLVLIDGVEANDPALGSRYDFGELLVSDIERIEILRGPQSALYGSDAVGGVVNIITRRGKGGLAIRASVEGGAFETVQSKASISGGGKRYDLTLSGAYFSTGGISAASEERGNTENDSFRNGTVGATASIRPLDNLDISLTGRWQKGKLDTDGFGTAAVDDSSFTRSVERFGRADVKLTLFDGKWAHKIAGELFENDLENEGGAFGASSSNGLRRKFQYQTDLTLEAPKFLESTHALTFGVDSEREEVLTKNAFSTVDRALDTVSIYGNYQIGLWDRLFLSGGGRFDSNDIFEDAATFRTTAALQFPETGTKLHGSVGSGVKNPTVFELFGFTSTFSGNPNLKPEESLGFDVGVEQTLLDGRITGDVTFFYNRIDDLILGFGNTAVNQDGSSHIKGIEFSGKAKIVSGLSLDASYTWMIAEDANDKLLVRRPRHMASLNLHYEFLEKQRARIDIGLRYNGDQRDIDFSTFDPVTLDDHVLLDIAAAYRASDTVEFFLRGENLLDQEYEEVFSFGTPGIGVFAGMRVKFGPTKQQGAKKG